jgi:hypothetical protein
LDNKYLIKVAVSPPASLTSKLALGVSSLGLVTAGANYSNGREARILDKQKLALEQEKQRVEAARLAIDKRSLTALNSIHKSLSTDPAHVKTN